MELIQLSPQFFNEVLDTCSKTTVGKILKRVDIFDNKQVLKKEIKELIYEEYRNIKALLDAHSKGVQATLTPTEQERPTRVITFK